jgi:hypothetical protein
MCNLTPSEKDPYLNLVALFEEIADMFDFEIEIMFAYLR